MADGVFRNDNQLPWLSGVPGSVRTLSAASNMWVDLSSCVKIWTDI